MKNKKTALGLGKVKYSSSAALVSSVNDQIDYQEIELVLSERLLRKKSTGAWPKEAIKKLSPRLKDSVDAIVDNRDVVHPKHHEEQLNKLMPFLESLKSDGLEQYSSYYNSEVCFLTHHLAHAHLARFFSPFEKTLILVFDGAGTKRSDFSSNHRESSLLNRVDSDSVEERSLYLLENGELTCLEKKWQKFETYQGQTISDGLGIFYEKIAEYIFNSNQAAGKVMGLAAFGKPSKIISSKDFLKELDWSKAYQGRSKSEWESSSQLRHYQDLAASAQGYFESEVITYLERVSLAYPEIKNLILVGGCALNCTTNAKINESKLFNNIYVPPCPGDGGISLGCAFSSFKRSEALTLNYQHAYWGSKGSAPENWDIPQIFNSYSVSKTSPTDVMIMESLKRGDVIAWFQGRSECGPRALGHRSLLASLEKADLKKFLNEEIKFREEFRPYGCSVLFEEKEEYFEVDEDFENPYMSFAVKIKKVKEKFLKEVSHIDGTSRMQTVRKEQSPEFYQLLKAWGEYSGQAILLNTSLNIMGEPIVETPEDALRFFQQSKVRVMVIGDYLVRK